MKSIMSSQDIQLVLFGSKTAFFNFSFLILLLAEFLTGRQRGNVQIVF